MAARGIFYCLLRRESSFCALQISIVSLPITSISSQQTLILSLLPQTPQYFGLPYIISATTLPQQVSTSTSLTSPKRQPFALLITSLQRNSVMQQFILTLSFPFIIFPHNKKRPKSLGFPVRCFSVA